MKQPAQFMLPFPAIPDHLAAACNRSPERRAWLERLPEAARGLMERWELQTDHLFSKTEGSCSWIIPVLHRDGSPAVLKLGMPHMEAEQEIDGLRFLDGEPTVRLFEADHTLNAMLLERCRPGTALRALPEPEQDQILAGLLRRFRRGHSPSRSLLSFRHLSTMLDYWSRETVAAEASWPDPEPVREGLRLFRELSQPSPQDVLLATDLHAGNVLRAEREPWLAIDPKPFVGDPAYDATQHLLNCRERLAARPEETIARFADLLELDRERVRLWTFARAAAEPRENWNDGLFELAQRLG